MSDAPTSNPELNELLRKAKDYWERLTPEQREEQIRLQRESYVRAEMSWPAPRFRWKNGVKVYESLEDFYND